MSTVRILIADDHALVRESLTELLNRDARFKVVGGTGSGREAVALACALVPHIVLMDIQLQELSGLEATREIRRLAPSVQVVAVSLYTQWSIARQMLGRGAQGYVTKSSPWSELIEALEQVSAGYRYICRELRQRLSEQEGTGGKGINALTPRELEIIQLVRRGASSREIALILKVAPKTVEAHRHHILRKLKLNSTTALMDFIHTHGLEG